MQKKIRYGFVQILTLLVVIGLLSLGVYLQTQGKLNPSLPATSSNPTPSQSPNGDLTNWKTYTYTGLGFSFKLPPNWQVDPSPKADIKIIESDYGVEGPQFLIGPSETIKSLNQKKDENKIGNSKEIVKGYIGYAGMLSKDSSKETQIDIDGKSAVKRIANENFKFFEEVSIPLKGNYKLILMIEKLETQQVFDQILSTFKFTNQDKAFCGGIAGTSCPSGYICKLEGNYPDAGGTCMKQLKEGNLEATVVRSPTCPGPVTEQKSCESPYSNGTFTIIKLPDNQVVQTINTDKDGTFIISLAPGVYNLQNTESGIGKNIRNSNFTITSGKTTIQKFDIDTGIR